MLSTPPTSASAVRSCRSIPAASNTPTLLVLHCMMVVNVGTWESSLAWLRARPRAPDWCRPNWGSPHSKPRNQSGRSLVPPSSVRPAQTRSVHHDVQMVRRRRQTACERQRLAKSIVRDSPLSHYIRLRHGGWMSFLASVRRSLPLRSPASLIRRLSDQGGISRPGSGCGWRLQTFAAQNRCSRRCSLGLVLPTFWTITRVSLMNHTATRCDCDPAAGFALAFWWPVPVYL